MTGPTIVPRPRLTGPETLPWAGYCNVPFPVGDDVVARCAVEVRKKLSRHAWVDRDGRTVNHKGPHRLEWT